MLAEVSRAKGIEKLWPASLQILSLTTVAALLLGLLPEGDALLASKLLVNGAPSYLA